MTLYIIDIDWSQGIIAVKLTDSMASAKSEDKVCLHCHNSLTTRFEIVIESRTDYGSNQTGSKGAARGQGLFTLP